MAKKLNEFLLKIGYIVDDVSGKTNKGLNILDIAFNTVYFFLTSINLWIFGIGKISYWLIIIISIRSIFKYWRRFSDNKSNNKGIPFTYLFQIMFFVIIFFIFTILFFALYSTDNPNTIIVLKILVNSYYLFVSFFELIDILTNMFKATPRNFL